MRIRIVGSDAVVEEFDSHKSIIPFKSALHVKMRNSHWHPAVRKWGWSGRIKFFRRVKDNIVFNVGLLPMVKTWCKSHRESFKVIRPVSKIELTPPSADMLAGITLRDDQLACIQAFLDKRICVIQAGTGAGKTEIACGAVKCLGVKTLVLVPTRDLLSQTKQRLRDRLKRPIGTLAEKVFDSKTVTVASIMTLASIIKRASVTKDNKGKKLSLIEINKRRQRLNKLQRYLDSVELVVGDEVQFAKSKSWSDVLDRCTSARYRLGLSARPFSMKVLPPLGSKKLKADDLGIVASFGPVVTNISTSSLVEKGILARPHIMLLPIQEPADDFLPYKLARKELIIENDYRNREIAAVARQFVEAGLLTLIVVGFSRKHGEILEKMLKKDIPKGVYYLNGSTETEVREQVRRVANRSGKVKIIIATTIYDLGIDIPRIGGLIMAAGGREPRRTIQRLGRSLRKKEVNLSHVVDAIDYTNPYLHRHSMARLQEYLDEDAYIVELVRPKLHSGKVKNLLEKRNSKKEAA